MAIRAHRRSPAAINNAAVLYDLTRQFPKAAAYYQRTIDLHAPGPIGYTNLARSQLTLGDTIAPGRTLDAAAVALPDNFSIDATRFDIHMALHRYDSAEVAIRSMVRKLGDAPLGRMIAGSMRSMIAMTQGRLLTAASLATEAAATGAAAGIGRIEDPLLAATTPAVADIYFRHEARRGIERLDRALAEHPLAALPPVQRPYNRLAMLYALGGQPARARRLLAERDREVPAGILRTSAPFGANVQGYVELAEGNAAAAVATFRTADTGACLVCALPGLARAHDAAGRPDSAIAIYARYLNTADPIRGMIDANWLAPSLVRLGELYEARGDKAQAIAAYGKFIALWKDADPDLQPIVADVRNRVEVLSGRERGSAGGPRGR